MGGGATRRTCKVQELTRRRADDTVRAQWPPRRGAETGAAAVCPRVARVGERGSSCVPRRAATAGTSGAAAAHGDGCVDDTTGFFDLILTSAL